MPRCRHDSVSGSGAVRLRIGYDAPAEGGHWWPDARDGRLLVHADGGGRSDVGRSPDRRRRGSDCAGRCRGIQGRAGMGINGSGQLGDGTTTNKSTPTEVSLPSGVASTSIAAGAATGYAIGSDSNLYAWGTTPTASSATGPPRPRPRPSRSLSPRGSPRRPLPAVGASDRAGPGTPSVPTAASTPGGRRRRSAGQRLHHQQRQPGQDHPRLRGDGHRGGSRRELRVRHRLERQRLRLGVQRRRRAGERLHNGSTSPVKVSLPSGVTATAIAAGATSAYAIGSDGNVYAWGHGAYGELGNGSTSRSTTPVKVSLPSGVTAKALSAGSSTGFVIGPTTTCTAGGTTTTAGSATAPPATNRPRLAITLAAGVTPTP